MRLLILNGSPRPARSNTKILLGHFDDGFSSVADNRSVTLELLRPSHRAEALATFFDYDAVLLAFPLSIDAMTSVVKEFIESLGERPLPATRPKLLFLVQSGFPEATHTAPVARYLERLAERLGCGCVGVMRRGGVEGIQQYPAWMTRKLLRRFRDLGSQFGHSGTLDRRELAHLAGPERVPRLMLKLGTWISHYLLWNKALGENGTFARRFDTPYRPKSASGWPAPYRPRGTEVESWN